MNEIDTLMDLMDLDPLLAQPRDIDAIIAYHRKARAKIVEGGGARPKRESGPKLDISGITKALVGDQPATEPMKRRV